MADKFIFNEIAQSVKQCLIDKLGRLYILPYEWIYLKANGFPFDIPVHKTCTGLASRIEMADLDVSPLIYILEQRFSCRETVEKDIVEEYAWKIVMNSISCVWGG